ncbi:MAG: hypothetical protein K0R28_998 [Paenibacillus sp.]|nr:hypothetical protein [Paenibacillus sp.]
MSMDIELKRQLEQASKKITVPESLYRFADNVPDLLRDQQEYTAADLAEPSVQRKPRLVSAYSKTAAAAIVIAVIFCTGVKISPAFASYMKDVPGFHIAVEWLTQVRQDDGVQRVIANGYTPIDPVTAQFGTTNITIGDVYLTDEELLFKAFISTGEFDVTDDRAPVHFFVAPGNLRGGGSTTHQAVIQGADGSPILQTTYKYHLEPDEARDFLANNHALLLELNKTSFDSDTKRAERETMGTISVPVDPSKLLHNKVSELGQKLPVPGADPDIKELTLEKLTIQPTTMNAILSTEAGWSLDFPAYSEDAPFFRDSNGNEYPYNPAGPGLLLEKGKLQLPFSSSVYFENGADSLSLHIGTVRVTEERPSGSFDLSLKGAFPQTVRFKNKQIVIESAEYNEEGYLYMTIRKNEPDQISLDGVAFSIEAYREQRLGDKEMQNKFNSLREQLEIDGWGTARNGWKRPYLELYIPAPKQETYRIDMQRANDPIAVNKAYPVKLK